LKQNFPTVTFSLVDNVSKIDPFLADAEVLMTHGPYLSTRSDHVLGNMPKLRWVQGTGTGVDNIIDRPSLPSHVLVTNMRGAHGPQMSEAAIGSMLALSRRMPRTIRNQDKHVWERWLPRIIHGKTVGILGVGVIAEALAPRCKALGMKVIGFSNSIRAVDGFDRMLSTGDLKRSAGELDFLVLLTPYSEATHHIVNEDVLMAMKPGSILINLARGGVLDEAALIKALEAGPLEGAALDVFSKEPLPEDHPFWSMEKVIITCHMGGLTDDYHLQALPIIETNLRHYLADEVGQMVNVVRKSA
jgi:phosphoglycerate dehydrogenase-like enzyme